MTDMESLDRAVEEAITDLIPKYTDDGWEVPIMRRDLQPLIAAVSERARAEERERIYEEQRAQSKTWPIPGADVTATVAIPWNTFPARSSEEAGNG